MAYPNIYCPSGLLSTVIEGWRINHSIIGKRNQLNYSKLERKSVEIHLLLIKLAQHGARKLLCIEGVFRKISN